MTDVANTTSAEVDLTCNALGQAGGPADALHQFIVGVDASPVELTAAEIENLGDAFARILLSRGIFPTSGEEVLTLLSEQVDADHPLHRQRKTFVVGEGTQLPPAVPGSGVRAFLATCGASQDGPDLIVSVLGRPSGGFVEVMAWDEQRGGFNYYQTRNADSPWVLAGNSADALVEGSAKHGPFESHPAGHFLMKELRFPWVHWHSSQSPVRPEFLPADIASHPWFTDTIAGADELELGTAMPAIRRWTRVRFEAAVADDGTFTGVNQVIASLVDNPTINLITSRTQMSKVANDSEGRFDVPAAFFFDVECVVGLLELPAPDLSTWTASSSDYLAILERHAVTLRDDAREPIVPAPSDTHFVFLVPERAFEDIETVRAAIDVGLITRRLAACLLMVDFPNPVFSQSRASLQQHAPATARVEAGASDFSEAFAQAILGSDAAQTPGSAEAEFANHWKAGDDWPTLLGRKLEAYYQVVADLLETPEGLESLFRLAESRRRLVRQMPIAENPLLFARPDPPLPGLVALTADGAVVEVSE